MLCIIKYSNEILLTKGNTARINIGIESDNEQYIPQSGDVVQFELKKRPDEAPILTKTIPNETLTLCLEPNDTKSLNAGTYHYDVKITTESGEVYTFISDNMILFG